MIRRPQGYNPRMVKIGKILAVSKWIRSWRQSCRGNQDLPTHATCQINWRVWLTTLHPTVSIVPRQPSYKQCCQSRRPTHSTRGNSCNRMMYEHDSTNASFIAMFPFATPWIVRTTWPSRLDTQSSFWMDAMGSGRTTTEVGSSFVTMPEHL